MTGRNIFLSYATGKFIPARDALCRSAAQVGFDEVRPRGYKDLDPAFASAHQAILSQPRGAGYWLWKPQIILQELRTLAPGDLLVYCDAGRSAYYQLRRFPNRLAKRARAEGFLLGPTIGQHGPMARWTKRDAFVLMGMDTEEMHQASPIQAGWNFWTPVPAAFTFLDAWVTACADARILTDCPNTQGLPNLRGFRDHRHDQAILSLLARQRAASYLHLDGTITCRLLKLRSKSNISNMFLKRIDDGEFVTRNNAVIGLIRSLIDIRKTRSQ